MSVLINLLIGLCWGLGIALIAFACALFYRIFDGSSPFNNPLIPMGISFGSITLGTNFLYLAIVYST